MRPNIMGNHKAASLQNGQCFESQHPLVKSKEGEDIQATTPGPLHPRTWGGLRVSNVGWSACGMYSGRGLPQLNIPPHLYQHVNLSLTRRGLAPRRSEWGGVAGRSTKKTQRKLSELMVASQVHAILQQG